LVLGCRGGVEVKIHNSRTLY